MLLPEVFYKSCKVVQPLKLKSGMRFENLHPTDLRE
jgi:hypothetical protein